MDVQWYSKLGGSVLGSQIRVRFYCILVSSTVQKQAFLGDQRLNCPWVRLWEWTVCEACDGLVLCPGFGSYEVGENWKLKLMHWHGENMKKTSTKISNKTLWTDFYEQVLFSWHTCICYSTPQFHLSFPMWKCRVTEFIIGCNFLVS